MLFPFSSTASMANCFCFESCMVSSRGRVTPKSGCPPRQPVQTDIP